MLLSCYFSDLRMVTHSVQLWVLGYLLWIWQLWNTKFSFMRCSNNIMLLYSNSAGNSLENDQIWSWWKKSWAVKKSCRNVWQLWSIHDSCGHFQMKNMKLQLRNTWKERRNNLNAVTFAVTCWICLISAPISVWSRWFTAS